MVVIPLKEQDTETIYFNLATVCEWSRVARLLQCLEYMIDIGTVVPACASGFTATTVER